MKEYHDIRTKQKICDEPVSAVFDTLEACRWCVNADFAQIDAVYLNKSVNSIAEEQQEIPLGYAQSVD